MTHPTREEWMAYLYGELEREKQASLKAHLRQCRECRRQIVAWRSVMSRLNAWQFPQQHRAAGYLRRGIGWAAAAVLLIAAGCGIARLWGASLDADQLRALESSLKSSLAPAIRRQVLIEQQMALAEGFVQLRDELGEQLRGDLNEFALETLAASSAVTNQRLAELVEAVNAAQTRDRRWMAAALEQIELNRLQDSTELRGDLARFAVLTESELLRTKQDVAEWLTYGRPDMPTPEKSKKSEPLK